MSERFKQPESEAEYARALREAFVAGSEWRVNVGPPPVGNPYHVAARRYPITRTVPRVVTDEFMAKWKVDAGTLWYRDHSQVAWRPADEAVHTVTRERVRLWSDLIANPTVETSE